MDECKTHPPEHISPVELAKLAAIIDPVGCRSGNSRDALLHALALFEESANICFTMGSKSAIERLDLLTTGTPGSMSGTNAATRLFYAIANPIWDAPQPVLTLAASDNQADTMRPYLAKHLNLEGKAAARKQWSRVRTLHENLKAMFIDRANKLNQDNAPHILAREQREEGEARERGCSIDDIRQDSRLRYDKEQWRDGEADFKSAMERAAVKEGEEISHYEFNQSLMDEFIRWKREIRKNGGIKAVRPLSRKEVFRRPVKQKNPKSGK